MRSAPDARPTPNPAVPSLTARPGRAWLGGVAMGLVGVLARALAQPLLGNELPFLFAYPAFIAAALLWGPGAGLCAALVCALAVAMPFAPPHLPLAQGPLQIGAYLLVAIFTCLMIDHLARKRGAVTSRLAEQSTSGPRAGASEHVSAAGVAPTPMSPTGDSSVATTRTAGATATWAGSDAAASPPGDPEDGAAPAGEPAASPLTSWLRTVLTGTVLIPVAIFVCVAWWGYTKTLEDAHGAVTRASALALDHAQRTFAIAHDVARRTARMTDADDADVRRNETALRQRVADLVAGLPSTLNVTVWDAQGRALLRSDAPADADASNADRAYFIEQRDRSPGVGISEVLRGRQTGQELVNLTIRRPASDGGFRGIVTVSLSPDYFRQYYNSLSHDDPRLSSFALLRTDGLILARSPPPPDGQDRVPPDSPSLRRVAAGETAGTHEVPAQRGREARIVSFRRVADLPMYLVVGFSREAVLADWWAFLTILAAIMVPTTAGLFWVTWVALKKTRREQFIARELREQIRRRSAAERTALEAQRLKTLSVLTSGVAHDFNNLLAIVNTSLHVLRLRNPALADDRQMQAMNRAIQSGVRLTRQLLSFSGKQALKPEVVRLQTFLPAVAEMIRSSLGANIRLQLSIAPDTAAVRVDPAELELALINLGLNARHALPDGGTIVLAANNDAAAVDAAAAASAASAASTAPAAPAVTISVCDNGVGIAADLLPRVREAFFTTRQVGAGSGLGLTQVDALVEQSGGSMRIDSREGHGTTVSLRFPAHAAPPEGDGTGERTLAARLQGRLLLVEDNDEVAAATRSLLAGWGIEVACVGDAGAALAYLDRAAPPPDVVLSDIAMPGPLNGIDLALRLRAQRPRLRVLLTTGYAEQLDVARQAGVEVLPKPIPPADLLARLQRMLGDHSADPADRSLA